MRKVTKNFTEFVNGQKVKHIIVNDDFEPLNRLPKEGFKWVWTDFENGLYEEEKIIISNPEKTPELEQQWVVSEFDKFVDPIVMMFWSGDIRANAYKEQDIKDYSKKLRDYVTSHDGILQINGDRPPRPEKHIKK